MFALNNAKNRAVCSRICLLQCAVPVYYCEPAELSALKAALVELFELGWLQERTSLAVALTGAEMSLLRCPSRAFAL